MRDRWEELALLSVKRQFDEFLRTRHDEDLASKIMWVGVAQNKATLYRKKRECIYITWISVTEKSRGRGLCRDFIAYAERCCRGYGLVLYVENILSPNLAGMLKKRGYKRRGKDMYLLPQKRVMGVKAGIEKADSDSKHPAHVRNIVGAAQ